MGLFGKKKEVSENKPGDMAMVRNMMDNHDLKVNLADTAMGLLVRGEDYTELANTQVTFGYIYQIERHGFEALYKITTDRTTAYFAAQGDKLMRLNFTEELFNSTVEEVLKVNGDKSE